MERNKRFQVKNVKYSSFRAHSENKRSDAASVQSHQQNQVVKSARREVVVDDEFKQAVLVAFARGSVSRKKRRLTESVPIVVVVVFMRTRGMKKLHIFRTNG